MSTPVHLSGGPRNGATVTVEDPWPRSYVRVDDGTGELVTYLTVNYDGPAPYNALYSDEGDLETGEDFEPEVAMGPEGQPGVDGSPGPPGAQGDPGSPVLPKGAWDEFAIYEALDLVSYLNSSWIALDAVTGTVPGTDATKWMLNAGGFVPRGAWSSATAYAPLDIISYDGDIWAAVAPGTNHVPGPVSAYWAKLIDGDDIRGPIGPQGVPGSPLPVREDAQIVTGSLAAGAGESGTVTLAKGYRVLRVDSDHPMRLRLYTTAAKRTADITRASIDDPTGDHGLVAEVITATTLLGLDLCDPTPSGYSAEVPPTSSIAYRVTNGDSVTRIITIDIVFQAQEN